MKNVRKKKTINLLLLILYPAVASALSLFFYLNFLWSIILFLLAPSIHLSFLLKKSVAKTTIFAIISVTPFVIVFDYIAHLTSTWFVPSFWGYRLLGQIPIEDVFWAIVWVYLVIMFYEYFLDSHRDRLLFRPHIKWLVAFMGVLLMVFVVLYFIAPQLLYIPYFYFWVGLTIVFIPILFELIRRPNLRNKFLSTATYFFYFSLIYEITALRLGWWSFPGKQVIGWVTLFGLSFPFEELFFWFMLAAMAFLAYYEFFDDDEK